VDGRVIGTGAPGPITLQLRQRFQELCRQDGVPVCPIAVHRV